MRLKNSKVKKILSDLEELNLIEIEEINSTGKEKTITYLS